MQNAEKQSEYDARRDELRRAADEQMASYRIFIVALAPVPRVLERIEAAVMNILYAASGPVSAIPDRGMALSPRWRTEEPMLVQSVSLHLFYGLPSEFEA